MDYINSLPLDKVKEIHLSGCLRNEFGEIIPNHSKMNEEDYEILDYLMKECKMLKVLTLEFGPYDIHTNITIPVYGKVNNELKEAVYENLLKLKDILNK